MPDSQPPYRLYLDPQRVREDVKVAMAEVPVKALACGHQLDSLGVCYWHTVPRLGFSACHLHTGIGVGHGDSHGDCVSTEHRPGFFIFSSTCQLPSRLLSRPGWVTKANKKAKEGPEPLELELELTHVS